MRPHACARRAAGGHGSGQARPRPHRAQEADAPGLAWEEGEFSCPLRASGLCRWLGTPSTRSVRVLAVCPCPRGLSASSCTPAGTLAPGEVLPPPHPPPTKAWSRPHGTGQEDRGGGR